jgi:REP element-mobilizing transposase RayT
MTDKKKCHNQKSLRLPNYEYTQQGSYFITAVTYQGQCLFGTINQDEMIYSQVGKIVKEVWQSIPDHFPNTSSDHFVTMPNHIHGIIKVLETRHKVLSIRKTAVPQLFLHQ